MRGDGLSLAALQPLAALERLDDANVPVALALSGGGNSLALLHLAKAWADQAGRRLIALTVDHRLQRQSAAWSRFAAERAGRLGVAHLSLPWCGEKPSTGLPAAARSARHALLADAARAAGASVILVAHTADDALEAELMRADGSTTPTPHLWSPSPAWPQGRGLFLLRPLLAHRRAELRAWLRALGEIWIDDPANDDLRYARPRARERLSGCALPSVAPREPLPPPAGLDLVQEGAGGDLTAPRSALIGGPEARRFVCALALCAAGTARPPSRASLDRLADRLAAPGDFVITLAGARVEAHDKVVRFCREAGERARGGLAAGPLPPGESVFDGRFLLATPVGGRTVAPLAGRSRRLSDGERTRLARIPAAVRGGLPAVIGPSGSVSCPLFDLTSGVGARSLTLRRLHAALGRVENEAAAILADSST